MRLSRHETKFKDCFQIAQVINIKTNQINSSAASVALNQFSNWKKKRHALNLKMYSYGPIVKWCMQYKC